MQTDKPQVKLVGENGNALNIISIVDRALRKAGQADKAEEFKKRAFASSYEEILAMLFDYVEPY